MDEVDWGMWSLAPLALTLILAFTTRSALIAMLVGTFAGTLMLGLAPGSGLNQLFQDSLGNADFIWICQIVILIGVLFELFKRSGVLGELVRRFAAADGSRRKVELSAWGMGFAIVDDYFSPLLTGAIMRPMSDKAGVPREKLAFILDATTASVCILVPYTAWGAYVASLIAVQGNAVGSAEEGLAVFIGAIPYNFYPMLMIGFTLLMCLGLIPDFGPMRAAEKRARETGQLLRPGARPLVTDDELPLAAADNGAMRRPSLLLELLAPVLLVVSVGVATLTLIGSVKIVEAFMLADLYLIALLYFHGSFDSLVDVGEVVVDGAKGVTAALLIVALAYALNAVTTQLGAADAIIGQFATGIGSNRLIVVTFLLTAVISFSTGTSWGAYALMMPVALPLAFDISGGEITPLVYQTVAAVAGGGIFGDHASPVSDTTVLSSVGASCDHIDHVVTQLPYALAMALLTALLYAVF
ncbi:MAG: transporter [Gammaproteobacteria bacterium]|nr:transporter [Gammaproteobacteria bacterium]